MKHLYIFFFLLSTTSVLGQSSDKTLAIDTLELADPTIFYDKGGFYLYGTNHQNGFQSYTSHDLVDWKLSTKPDSGFALKKGNSFGTKGFWAPQIFKHRQKYFMAYTADEEIAIAESDSPLGPFKQKNPIKISGSYKQIDPYVFIDTDGSKYLYHVKLTKGNRIFVSKLKDDFSDVISGTEKECIVGEEPWENTAKADWPVTEGPTVIKRDNLYYLFYSANDFRNIDYAVGYAVADNPLGPFKKFSGNPIISRKNLGINGTGHGDFFTDKKGNLYYVLHTHNSASKVSPRLTAIVKAAFKKQKEGPDVMQIDSASFRFLMIRK